MFSKALRLSEQMLIPREEGQVAWEHRQDEITSTALRRPRETKNIKLGEATSVSIQLCV